MDCTLLCLSSSHYFHISSLFLYQDCLEKPTVLKKINKNKKPSPRDNSWCCLISTPGLFFAASLFSSLLVAPFSVDYNCLFCHVSSLVHFVITKQKNENIKTTAASTKNHAASRGLGGLLCCWGKRFSFNQHWI